MPETFVIDCSVAAKWVLPEPGRPSALRLLDRHLAGEISLIAPDLLLVELASLLSKRHRRKQISAAQAREAFQLVREFAPELIETDRRLVRALDLSLRHQMSLWDCVYLALAIERDCPFLTSDQRLFRAGTGRHPAIQLFE
ncbi:MAG TPA: type II toxin-antitoxin system VapC family toxin [Bryobacteraceae bacterium]|nr:type II toxin-antitoxin system VapC family toxin [Bryobacteraceae bacterium]